MYVYIFPLNDICNYSDVEFLHIAIVYSMYSTTFTDFKTSYCTKNLLARVKLSITQKNVSGVRQNNSSDGEGLIASDFNRANLQR